MDTGEIICRGDFGSNLCIFNRLRQQFPKPNNAFPLRLTPNLNHFLTPNLVDALLTLPLATMASVMVSPEDKLEQMRRKLLNPTQYCEMSDKTYELLDRQLLNKDFQWAKELNFNAAHIVSRIKELSYPVFAEPPFSFKNYDLAGSAAKDAHQASQFVDAQDQKSIESMDRVAKMVDDVKSICMICEMPPNWNPFF